MSILATAVSSSVKYAEWMNEDWGEGRTRELGEAWAGVPASLGLWQAWFPCTAAGPGGEQSEVSLPPDSSSLAASLLLPAPYQSLSLIRSALPHSHCFPSVGFKTLLGPTWGFRSVETQRALDLVSSKSLLIYSSRLQTVLCTSSYQDCCLAFHALARL